MVTGRKCSPKRGLTSKRSIPVSLDSITSLRMVLEAADMVTWEWDLRTGIIRYSDNVPKIAVGEEIEAYTTIAGLLQSIHPEDRENLARALDRTQAEGCPFECEYRVRLLDNQYHWILGKGNSVFLEGGSPVRVLGVSQDITARKQAEEKLHVRSRQLAKLAAELIAVEYHERRRLADLVREHLQQLLVAARIQVHAIAATEKGPQRDQLMMLRRTLDDSLELTRSIMKDLAPPAHPHEDSAVAFGWLAQEMLQRHQLTVTVRIHPNFSDADEVRTVLLFTAARELLQNVVKHAGVRKVSLRLQRQNGCLELKVSDKGKGFDPQKLQAVRARQGFGLFSIRQRAELLGGKLEVTSAPGRGTTVFLSLPLGPQPANSLMSDDPGSLKHQRTKSAAGKSHPLLRTPTAPD